MLRILRKMPWAPVVVGAMLAMSLCMARPVSAQALAGSIGPSVSPTGYFDCSLSGVWDDDGHSWAIFIYVDGNLVYAWNSFTEVTGPVDVFFDGNFGALVSGNPFVDPPIGPPGDPVYGTLSGTHSCRMQYIKSGTVTPLYDTGVVYETF